MSELEKNHKNKIEIFDRMSTEELEEILRQNSELPQGEGYDMGAILYISEVIAKREEENPTGRFTDVSAAWKSFKQDYYPIAFDGKTILDGEDEAKNITSNIDMLTNKAPAEKYRRPISLFSRVASVAAIVVAVLLAGTATAYAMGFDLWGAVAQWSRETFSFTVTSEPSAEQASPLLGDELQFDTIQEALDFYGIEGKLAPTWFPEGYEMTSIEVNKQPEYFSVFAGFTSENSEYVVSITKITNGETVNHEKDDGKVTIYEAGGVSHYVMTNVGRSKAAWVCSDYECYISGNISETELKNIIDSIYER